MTEESVQVANGAIAQALKEVNHYNPKIMKIEETIKKIKEKIDKIEEEIEKIDKREDFTGNEPRYKSLKQLLEDKKERLKEADNHLNFYFQLRAGGRSTSKQSITGKRKLAEIRDDLSTPSCLAQFSGKGCWKDLLKELGDQIDCHRITMDSNSLPITLMHRVFADFVQNCQSVQLSNESCMFANALCQTMLRIMNQKRKWLKLPETC